MLFLKDNVFQWWTNKQEQELEMITNLTCISFKEFLIERFTLEYKKLREKVNLEQMRHTKSLKAYILDVFHREFIHFRYGVHLHIEIFLGGLQK